MESPNPGIRCEAVCAAGNWELDAAWRQVVGLVESKDTGKPLLLAAIDAVASIRPEEAQDILGHLAYNDDEEISEAVYDALGMAEGRIDGEFDDDENSGGFEDGGEAGRFVH